MPCILNAANEVANLAFRQDKITFPQLNQIIATTMQRVSFEPSPSLNTLLQTDLESRAIATELSN
jgi:1-deoxy-D-xylulose-5-phosphate reductoisomerase